MSQFAIAMPVNFYEGQKQVQTWGGRVIAFLGTKVFKKTGACCLMLAIYVWVGHMVENYFHVRLQLPAGDTAAIGAALSILMVLRTNSAYDRWWEGRKHWGSLVNNCRNLALKVETMSSASDREKALVGTYISLFPYVLRDHLRHGVSETTLSRLPEPAPADLYNVPAFIAERVFSIVKGWRDKDLLHRLDHHLMDPHISSLMDICGACERIRNTPLPLVYRALIPQLLVLYLVVVPLGVQLTTANLVLTLIIGYFLIGLELVAEEIEEPFGTDDDDLQLDRICKGIERSVRQILPELDEITPISDLTN